MDGVFAYRYTPAACLLVTGEDAADFLQSQFSSELRPFEAGQCTYGLWLDVKGKVIADAWVLCEGEEAFRIVSEHCRASEIAAKLEKHIIADDVEIEVQAGPGAMALLGAGAPERLVSLFGQCPEPGQFVRFEGGVAWGGRRSAQPSYELLFDAEASLTAFRERFEALGVSWVDSNRIARERLQAGIPQVPAEIGSGELPGEGGFERDAVSFTKGCYLGQEVVARMHNLGKARRALYILEGEGEVPTCPLPLTNDAGKTVGELRSAIVQDQGWRGVALLKIQHVAVGAVLSAPSGEVKIVNTLRH